MNKQKWDDCFRKLCIQYQKIPKELFEISKSYFENPSGGISKLGRIEEFEFLLLLDYLKEEKIKPDYGSIPQYYQLLELYESKIRPEKIYNEQQAQTEIEDCQLCDNTGFVPMFDMLKNVDIVCGCYCKKGKSIIENAKKRRVNITSYLQIKKNNRYILRDNVDDEIIVMSKELASKNNNLNDSKNEINKQQAHKILKMLEKEGIKIAI